MKNSNTRPFFSFKKKTKHTNKHTCCKCMMQMWLHTVLLKRRYKSRLVNTSADMFPSTCTLYCTGLLNVWMGLMINLMKTFLLLYFTLLLHNYIPSPALSLSLQTVKAEMAVHPEPGSNPRCWVILTSHSRTFKILNIDYFGICN